MTKSEEATCACVPEHRPQPMSMEYHHIWPQAMGGPTDPRNLIWICPTTHTNAHEILRLMVKRNRALLWGECLAAFDKPVSRYAYRLALLGFRRWTNHSLSG